MPDATERLFGSIDGDVEFWVGVVDFDAHGIALAMPKTLLRDFVKGLLKPRGVLEESEEYELDESPALGMAARRPNDEGVMLYWRTVCVMRRRHLVFASVRAPAEASRWSYKADAFLGSLRAAPPPPAPPTDAGR